MRRPAILYTLQQQVIEAYDIVSFYRQKPLPTHIWTDDSVLTVSERIDVPVRKCCRSTLTDHQHAHIDEFYIALDPELEYLMTMPLKKELDKQLMAYNRMINEYETRIEKFNTLPWYKRIFTTA